MPAPDRMLFARPRQPAAGRRPPLSPEHAETGRPLPRVTATDDSVPRARPQPAGRPRPPPGSPRRRTPGRRPTSTHDGSRLDPPPARPSRAARGPAREAWTRAAPPVRRPSRPGRTTGPPGTRRGTQRSPGSLTGPDLAGGAGAPRQWRSDDRAAVRPFGTRATLDDVAGLRGHRADRQCRRTNSSSATPAGRRALSRMPPGSARPGHRLPRPLGARAIGTGPPRCRSAARRPGCWGPGACAAPAPVEGTCP